MIDFAPGGTLTTSAISAISAIAAFALGSAYFGILGWTVRLLAARRALLAPALLTVARIVAAAALLTFAARLGPLPFAAALGGFLIARARALRAARGRR